MSESRVEKFKDYRNSIYGDDFKTEKEKINTSIEENSIQSKNGPSSEEEILIKKLISSRNVSTIFYIAFVVIVIALALIFGFLLF